MCFFSTHSKNAKMKKQIEQLKNERTPTSSWHSSNSNFEIISDMLNTWKQKGHHALRYLNEYTTQLKKKAKEHPKTTLALIAGSILTSLWLIRKNSQHN